MLKKAILFITAVVALTAGLSIAEIQNGAKDVVIPAGSQGPVKFPHHQHQQTVKDCMNCHDLYPQKPGAIQDLKLKGALAQKQVMNKQCINCHKAKINAGEKSGPVACATCHTR